MFWAERAVFDDRAHAGRRLAERVAELELADPVVVAIPRGGVAVGVEVAQKLGAPLGIAAVRKIPLPWNPEAGYGAVAVDGTFFADERVMRQLGISREETERLAQRVQAEVQRRAQRFGKLSREAVAERECVLVDDGLAAGYSMRAAILLVRKMNPRKLIVAVPVSPKHTAQEIAPMADEFICLHISEAMPFAVASFYREWHDMTDAEVLQLLDNVARA